MVRVVITGIGIICSLADDYPTLTAALRSCRHNIGPVTLFATDCQHPVAEIKSPLTANGSVDYRTTLLADKAIAQALSGLTTDDGGGTGMCFSTCTSGMLELENAYITALASGSHPPFSYSHALSVASVTETLMRNYHIDGPSMAFSTACSSSANALAYAYTSIKQGRCPRIVAGGADALCRLTYYGFQSLKVMAPVPCTPFAIDRQGMNIGEAAAMLLLESLASAQQRQAKIYGEIIGVGMSSDAYHMSAPDPQGTGAYRAMATALNAAAISPQTIDVISAHGTGTQQNDISESRAIHRLFGKASARVLVQANKSYLGHTLGAAGAVATVCAISNIENQFVARCWGWSDLIPNAVYAIPLLRVWNCRYGQY